MLTREQDVLDYGLEPAQYAFSSTSRVSYYLDNVTPWTLECATPKGSDVDLSDKPLPRRTQEQRQQRGKKRGRESESYSPFTRKIHIIQQQLDDLIHKRATLNRI